MVKRKNMMLRNLLASIRASMGRYIAILAIIALGAGLFTGLRITRSNMIKTLQVYADQQGLFDLRLISTLGWTDADVVAFSQVAGVKNAEGFLSLDVLMEVEGTDTEVAYRAYGISEHINKPKLVAGRMPQAPNECLVDELYFSKAFIGRQLILSSRNEQSVMEALPDGAYTIVGIATSPLHLELDRGSTTIGNGSISAFIYLPTESFVQDIYTEIGVLLSEEYDVYSDAYDQAMKEMTNALEVAAQPLLERRFRDVLKEAQQQYRAGLAEYGDGLAKYDSGVAEMEKELADAWQELEDAQAELDENRKLLEDGQAQLEEGWKTLDSSSKTLTESIQALANSKTTVYSQLSAANKELLTNYKTVTTALRQIETGLEQLNEGILQIENGLMQIENGLSQIDLMLSVMDAGVKALESTLRALDPHGTSEDKAILRLRENLAEMQEQKSSYETQRQELLDTQEELTPKLSELKLQQQELIAQKETLEDALEDIDTGFLELQTAQAEADNQFSAAQAQLDAAQAQLEAGRAELEAKELEIQQGLAALEEGQAQLDAARKEYDKGKAEAQQELADAKVSLDDAHVQLEDARKFIQDLEIPDLYVLDRNTNTSYVSFEGSADILHGVARIFPVFFLAVAALVCITTMTRMVYEERTQIGILKALGYSGAAIMSKYMLYSGTAAVVGCTVGTIAGSLIFPQIIWIAYGMLYHFSPRLELGFDWPLMAGVTAAYCCVTVLATWYCCKRELQAVPADLMRPKAPTAGKQILLEKMRVWKRISFLNKVAIRNIIRYRQRLAMMLLGIGGCTALLLTGFGLRDSVAGIVEYQFDKVLTYDVSITFSHGQDAREQEEFRQAVRGKASQTLFVHSGAMDIQTNSGAKSVTMIASDRDLNGYISMRQGDVELAMPQAGEVLVSIGTADSLGIQVGDRVTLCSPDMEMLELTVSGIFNNHVGGYVIVHSQSILDSWGNEPEEQTAFVCVQEDQDHRELAAHISEQNGVINVSVNQDMAEMVGGMMDALDGVIVLVVVCAGLLAAIVLYNLTNINIQERIREIATIKVLGFRGGETGAYVFKENLALSAMGMLIGLVGGIFLHRMVMAEVKLDMVWFDVRIDWLSYVSAAVLTIVAACLVDFVMYFKLGKINMAEALKSVE